jgi:hypothetical protein
MRPATFTVSAAILGVVLGYFCYTVIGDRYHFFDRPKLQRARFDRLTGELHYWGMAKLDSFKIVRGISNAEWKNVSADDEILFDVQHNEPLEVLYPTSSPGLGDIGPVVKSVHKFREQRDIVTGQQEYRLVIDTSVVIRPSENKYRWEKAGPYLKVPKPYEVKVYDRGPRYVTIRFP